MNKNNNKKPEENDDYMGLDTVTLIDDYGNPVEYEHLDTIEYNGEAYVAMNRIYDDPVEMLEADGELTIMKVVYDEKLGEDVFEFFSDEEEEYEEVLALFLEDLNDMYEIQS